MTQITVEELAAAVCPECNQQETLNSAMLSGGGGALMTALFCAGLVLGKLWKTSGTRGKHSGP